MKKIKNLSKKNVSNKKKKNFDSKNLKVLQLKILSFSYRRSAIAQRQKEEELAKGKLTAEEAKRQVRTKKYKNINHKKISKKNLERT